jgi:hypothetical protein
MNQSTLFFERPLVFAAAMHSVSSPVWFASFASLSQKVGHYAFQVMFEPSSEVSFFFAK